MLEHVDTVISFAVVMLLLSLLVTALVQIAVTLLSLRSRVLKKGIVRLLEQVGLGADAAAIAKAVVCHQAVAAGKPCTTALKKEELIQLLSDLAGSPTSPLSSNAKSLLNGVLQATTLPQMQALAGTIQTDLGKIFTTPTEVAQIKRIVDGATKGISNFGASVTAWFDMVMDRTTDEFRRWTRWITIGCAVVLPFVFHVDSLQIFRQLASNPETRAKLVQMTDATLDKAAQVFALAEGSKSMASMAIQQACAKHPEIAAVYELEGVPNGLATRAQGIAWLKVKFREPKDPDHLKVFMAAYDEKFDEYAAAQFQGLAQCAKEVKTSLDDSALTIFELPDTSKDFWADYRGWWKDRMHFWGVLVTAVFLSLGAPFWYNALKQLSNLRPAIAQKVEQASTKE
jgi:hypothetical protein